MFQYCLFDLDGTLTDSREGITKSAQYALRHLGIIEPDLKKLERFIGPPLKDSFMEFYGLSGDEAEEAVKIYRERFAPIGIYENKVFEGIPEMLAHLQQSGQKLAVASSKPAGFVRQILQNFKIDRYFAVIVGSEFDGSRSAKEEVVEEALLQLGILQLSPQERRKSCAMVGDRKFDIQGAKAYGLTGIGVSFGFADEGELEEAGADILVDSVKELEEALLG